MHNTLTFITQMQHISCEFCGWRGSKNVQKLPAQPYAVQFRFISHRQIKWQQTEKQRTATQNASSSSLSTTQLQIPGEIINHKQTLLFSDAVDAR